MRHQQHLLTIFVLWISGTPGAFCANIGKIQREPPQPQLIIGAIYVAKLSSETLTHASCCFCWSDRRTEGDKVTGRRTTRKHVRKRATVIGSLDCIFRPIAQLFHDEHVNGCRCLSKLLASALWRNINLNLRQNAMRWINQATVLESSWQKNPETRLNRMKTFCNKPRMFCISYPLIHAQSNEISWKSTPFFLPDC